MCKLLLLVNGGIIDIAEIEEEIAKGIYTLRECVANDSQSRKKTGSHISGC